MLILGCDLHTRYQQIAMVDATGEVIEGRLGHENSETRSFYEGLPRRARIGIEATFKRNGSNVC